MLNAHVLKGTSTSLAGNFTLCLTCFGYCKYLLAVKVTNSSLQDVKQAGVLSFNVPFHLSLPLLSCNAIDTAVLHDSSAAGSQLCEKCCKGVTLQWNHDVLTNLD